MPSELQTEYICPQCREKVLKMASKYMSKTDDAPRRYFCKACGWTRFLNDKDAERMHKDKIW